MSDVKNKTVNIYIDSNAAEFALGRLQVKALKLEEAIQQGRDAGKSMITEISNLSKVEKSITDVRDQISKGLQPTFVQMKAVVFQLNNELRRMSENDPAFAEKARLYQKANAELAAMKTKINGVNAAQAELVKGSSGITKVGVFFASLAANIATGLVSSLQAAAVAVFDMRVQFEKSVANLSAITGATGADLDYLKTAAIDLSKTSSQSAVDFVEAFKLIGSAKPELLGAKEDLVAVTKAALLLSQASGLELPDAAKRLTDALNQFGAPAADAAKYVDALAAASKYGAAEVPDITDALLQFGTQAKSSNISIYESSGAIELLAEKGLKGADAGTKLRNVFLALNASKGLPKEAQDSFKAAGINTDILSDKSLSLEDRLKELSKIQNNSTAILKVFGKENFNAAQIVLQNIPRYAELTRQVNEQGVATQQAAVNTDTLSNKWQEFKNLMSSFFLEGDNNPLKRGVVVLTVAAQGLHDILSGIVTGIKVIYNDLALTLGLAKDLVTFDFKGAKDRFNAFGDQKDAAEKLKQTEKERLQIAQQVSSVARDAAKNSLVNQEALLKQNIALRDASLKTYTDITKSGKFKSDEEHKAALQYLRDRDTVLAIEKVIADTKNRKPSGGGETDGKKTVDSDSVAANAEKQKQLLNELEAFNKKLQDLKFESEQAGKSADKREIDAVKEKYKKIFDEYKILADKLKGSKLHIDLSTSDISNEEKDELAALDKKQKQKHFEDEQKQIKENLTKAYQEQQQITDQQYGDEKDKQSKRFVAGEIDRTVYEANIAHIEAEASKAQLANAEKFAAETVIIDGKKVIAVEQAAKDVTKFLKIELDKQTADTIKAYQAQEAERLMIDELLKKGKTAAINTDIIIAKGKGDTDGVFAGQKKLLDEERDQKLEAFEKERTDKIKSITETGTLAMAAEFLINDSINKQIDQANADHDDAVDKAERAKIEGKISKYIGYAQQSVDLYSKFAQVQANKENATLKKELSDNDKKKAGFKHLLDTKQISQQEYNRRATDLDKKYDADKEKIEKKQFERNKRLQIAQALINAAAAAVKLWVDPGFPAAIPLEFVLAAQTIAEIAVIASTKFAEGGQVKNLQNGKVNAARNIPTQSNGDDVLATVKVGEVLLNEHQQHALGGDDTFRSIGVPGFARGGTIKPFWERRPYKSIDYPAIASSMQIVKFAQGGLVQAQKGSGDAMQAFAGPLLDTLQKNQEALQQSHEVNILLMNTVGNLTQRLAAGIEANVSLKKFDDSRAQQDRIKRDAEFK